MTTYDLRTVTLLELIEAYGIECSVGGSGASADESAEVHAEITRRLEGIDRHPDEYRGSKALREGVRAEIEGVKSETGPDR